MPKKTFLKTLAVMLSASWAAPAPANSRLPDAPSEQRVQSAEKVFVGSLTNLKILKDDWCHADLKVTRAITGVAEGEMVPVQWRPKAAAYNAVENQEGLAVLRYKDGHRYWLRSDTFVDPKLASDAIRFLGKKAQ